MQDAAGTELGTCIDTAIARWNRGDWPDEVGDHNDIPIFETPVPYADNGYGMRVPVTLSVNLKVSSQLYFGQYPITRVSGFHDAIKGGVITNAFEVGMIDPEEVEAKWRRLDTVDEAPLKPVFFMKGLIGWPEG